MAEFVKLPIVWVLGTAFTIFLALSGYISTSNATQDKVIACKLDKEAFYRAQVELEKRNSIQFKNISDQLCEIKAAVKERRACP